MHEVIIWAQFLGAWLLVVGPLYQGSVELNELDMDREGIEGAKTSAMQAAPGRPSAWWWWLLPPVLVVEPGQVPGAIKNSSAMLSGSRKVTPLP